MSAEDQGVGHSLGEPARLALVCADQADRQTAITGALEPLGLTLQFAKDAPEAIDVMRKNAYEVIVLDEEFQGATPLDNPVLKAIAVMPITVRRYVLVALLGKDVKTFDNMTAFAKSVNVVVNVSDLPQLAGILRRALADNNEFYRVYHQVLRETGKR